MADNKADLKKKNTSYYTPIKANPIRNGKAYASIMVAEQSTLLEQLRYTRKQMDKEDKELQKLADEINKSNMEKKWSPSYKYLYDDL